MLLLQKGDLFFNILVVCLIGKHFEFHQVQPCFQCKIRAQVLLAQIMDAEGIVIEFRSHFADAYLY